MLRWLLRLVLALLAIRLIARGIARRRADPRPFHPDPGRKRGKPRHRRDPAADDIVDAEYEELPRR